MALFPNVSFLHPSMSFNIFVFMQKGAFISCIVGLVSILIIPSCYVETAKPSKTRQVVIASDYLTEGDTVIFAPFAKQHKTRVIIREIKANEVIGLIRNANHNSGLDLIMMKSLNSVLRLQKQGILHSLNPENPQFTIDTAFTSFRYNYIGVGFDPFVVRYDSDTLSAISEYKMLKDIQHGHTLSEEDVLAFLSPLYREYSKVEVFNWSKNWMKHTRHVELPISKSTDSVNAILGMYSDLYNMEDTSMAYLDKVSFPRGIQEGSYFNLRTMCIVNQAENYSDAKQFIRFYRNPGHNDELNSLLHTFPLDYLLTSRNDSFVLYAVRPEKLIQYQSMIRRVVNKLND